MSKPGEKVSVDERLFGAIKIMLRSGAMIKEIAEYMGVSVSTVNRIQNSETFDEYKNILKAMYGRRYPKKKEQPAQLPAPVPTPVPVPAPVKEEPPVQVVEHRQTVTIQATHYMMTEMQKTNELLSLISKKLAFIVDELTGTSHGRDQHDAV